MLQLVIFMQHMKKSAPAFCAFRGPNFFLFWAWVKYSSNFLPTFMAYPDNLPSWSLSVRKWYIKQVRFSCYYFCCHARTEKLTSWNLSVLSLLLSYFFHWYSFFLSVRVCKCESTLVWKYASVKASKCETTRVWEYLSLGVPMCESMQSWVNPSESERECESTKVW